MNKWHHILDFVRLDEFKLKFQNVKLSVKTHDIFRFVIFYGYCSVYTKIIKIASQRLLYIPEFTLTFT